MEIDTKVLRGGGERVLSMYKSVRSPFHTRKVSKCFTQTCVLGLLPCFKDFYFTFILTLTGVTAIQFWHRRSGASIDPTVKVIILPRLTLLQTPATSSGGSHITPTYDQLAIKLGVLTTPSGLIIH